MDEDAVLRAQIEVRAYTLWTESGQPEGRAEEFWHLARAQIESDNRPADPAGTVEVEPGAPPPAATPGR